MVSENIKKLTEGKTPEAIQALSRVASAKLREKRGHWGTFREFVEHVKPDFEWYKHCVVLAGVIDKVVSGEIKRLLIFFPPRHGKSEMMSRLFPAYYLSVFPKNSIGLISYGSDLAYNLSKDARANYLMDGHKLREDSQAVAEWRTVENGMMWSDGISGSLTGKGYKIGILDDVVKNREEAYSETIRESNWNGYRSTFYTRQEPNAAIILIMCVAEGERVLMGDGTWLPIEKIQIGDSVTGVENRKAVSKKVVAVKPQGEDDIYEVTSRSCKLKVNARHPFLVVRGGLKKSAKTQEDVVLSRKWNFEWVTTENLQVGDTVVTIKNLQNKKGLRPASFVKTESNHQMTQDDYWLFGFLFGDGWLATSKRRGHVGVCIAKSNYDDLNKKILDLFKRRFDGDMYEVKYGYYRIDNRKIAKWLSERGFSSGAKTKRVPQWVYKLRPCDKRAFLHGFFFADGWLRPSDIQETWTVGLANEELLDDLRLLARTCGVKTTKIHRYSHIAQPPHSPAPFLAHSYSAQFSFRDRMVELKGRYKNQEEFGRYFRLEDVESVISCGRKNVYDITVEGSENFIAEGFVVHNTRWHMDDLAGRILEHEEIEPENWHIVNFSADEKTVPDRFPKTCTVEPDWRESDGIALCPERYPIEVLNHFRETMGDSVYNALYRQRPAGDDGIVWKKDWFKDKTFVGKPPVDVFSDGVDWDTAYTEKEENAATAFVRSSVGMDGNIYITDLGFQWLEFPDMIKWMKSFDAPHYVENKASGKSAVQSLSKEGIMASEVKVSGGDKIARAKLASPAVESGKVFVRSDILDKLLEDEKQGILKFPSGKWADLNDAFVQALNRQRTFKVSQPTPKKVYKTEAEWMDEKIFNPIIRMFDRGKAPTWKKL